MQNLNTENLTALLKIMDEGKNDELIMKAEVLRNLGLFEESKQSLDKVKDPALNQIKDK